MKTKILTLAALALLYAQGVRAQIPQTISYQGMLTTSSAPANGSHLITIVLYDVASGGSALYHEEHQLTVTNGIFNVAIGSITPFPSSLTFDRQYYLGVVVDGGPELSPRAALASVPYALHAAAASSLDKGVKGVVTSLNGKSGDLTIAGGSGIALKDTTGSFAISNTGVLSASGTANQINVSSATGDLTFSLPQNIHPRATPEFYNIYLTGMPEASTYRNVVVAGRGVLQTRTAVLSAIGTPNQVYVSSDAGDVKFSLPQNIDYGATPQFAGLALTGIPANSSSNNILVSHAGALETRTIASLDSSFWALGGNGLPSSKGLGTTSNTDVPLIANSTEQMRLRASGGLNIPSTASTGVGAVFQNGTRFIHSYQNNNVFAGQNAGNFTMTGSDTTYTSPQDGQTISLGDGGNTGVGVNALMSNGRGFNNTAMGYLALKSNTTGYQNTAIGQRAMTWNTTGILNVGVGNGALAFNTTGTDNTAVGWGAMTKNTTGIRNTGVGKGALGNNTTGIANTAVGWGAHDFNISGNYNVAVGNTALIFDSSGSRNTAIGRETLRNSTASDNTAIGQQALLGTTTGDKNTAAGTLALINNSTGTKNVGIGYNTGSSNTTGSANTFIGYSANGAAGITNATAIGANASVTASNSLVLGNGASVGIGITAPTKTLDVNGTFRTTGAATFDNSLNISPTDTTGVGAIFQNGTRLIHSYGVNNIFVGAGAGNFTTTGSPINNPGPSDFAVIGDGDNTAVGSLALTNNTTGFENTAIGELALTTNTSGKENTAIGQRALTWNTTGFHNVGVGNGASAFTTTGSNNTTVGFGAGAHVLSGANNVAVGLGALVFDTSGARNVAIGVFALGHNNYISSSSDNTATGYEALFNATIGERNIAAGSLALFNNTSGAQNVAMGYNAGVSNTTENANTFLGYAANGANGITNATAIGANASVTASNSIVLGNGVNVGIGITAPTKTLDVNGTFRATGAATFGNALNISSTDASGVGVVFQNGVRYIHSFQNNNFFAGQNAGNFTMPGSDTAFTSVNDGQTISLGDGGNTGIGVNALASNARGFNNTAIGYLALTSNTTGFANTAVGQHALWTNTIGVRNTAIGISALNFNTTGQVNTALGFQTLTHNTTGDSSTAVGAGVLNFNTTGRRNTAIGFKALNSNTLAADNTAIGLRALFGNTLGERNTAEGGLALLNNTTGAQNVAIGYNAGLSNTTANANTFIGYAANGAAGITNATAIGANASVTASNSLVLGNGANVGIRTSTPRAELDVNSTGAIIVPVGTTAQQPAVPVQGMIRFNTTTNHFEGYNGTAWNNLD